VIDGDYREKEREKERGMGPRMRTFED